jgi:hypothetical protein
MSPRFGQIPRANLDVVLLVAVVLLATSLGVVRTQALYENSLSVHPEWVSTKATLHRGVMGALPFVSGQQALARNRLNLGAWFGFQEVLGRDSLDLARLEFRFRVEPEGYLHMLYDHRTDGFSGVRLSSRADSQLPLTSTADGEFTATTHWRPNWWARPPASGRAVVSRRRSRRDAERATVGS